jgi:hypothetical protein
MTAKAPMNTSAARKSEVRPRLQLDQPLLWSHSAAPAPVVYAGSACSEHGTSSRSTSGG